MRDSTEKASLSRRIWNVVSHETTGELVSFAVATLLVVNVFAFFITMMAADSSYAPTWRDYAKELGLETSKEYPLVMGRTIEGSGGKATTYARSGLFSATARASVSLQPDQAITMSFEHGDKSYILSLPFSKITFVRQEGVAPTVKVVVSNVLAHPQGTRLNTKMHYTCLPAIIYCHFVTDEGQNDPITSTNEWPTIQQNGLSALLNEHLDSVEIRLSPELYAQLLGTE